VAFCARLALCPRARLSCPRPLLPRNYCGKVLLYHGHRHPQCTRMTFLLYRLRHREQWPSEARGAVPRLGRPVEGARNYAVSCAQRPDAWAPAPWVALRLRFELRSRLGRPGSGCAPRFAFGSASDWSPGSGWDAPGPAAAPASAFGSDSGHACGDRCGTGLLCPCSSC